MQEVVASGISTRFRKLSLSEGQIAHVLLTRSPLEYPRRSLSARLACVKHAASVRPEPGSNSPSKPKTVSQENQTQAKKRQLAIARIIVRQLKKKPPPQPTKTSQPWQRDHTNQFIDKHTVEFSKIRRAPDGPLSRSLGGNLRKLTGPATRASNLIRLVLTPLVQPSRRPAGTTRSDTTSVPGAPPGRTSVRPHDTGSGSSTR